MRRASASCAAANESKASKARDTSKANQHDTKHEIGLDFEHLVWYVFKECQMHVVMLCYICVPFIYVGVLFLPCAYTHRDARIRTDTFRCRRGQLHIDTYREHVAVRSDIYILYRYVWIFARA